MQSAVELQEQLRAVREGHPLLVYRRRDGPQEIFSLRPAVDSVVIGRGEGSDVVLSGDPEISRAHAILERIGSDWGVRDDGISENGTFVNGERVQGRRRLRDGDRIRVGSVGITFKAPADAEADATAKAASRGPSPISDAQRRVLVALCRPYRDEGAFTAPATNRQIAEELTLSIDAVKTHMTALYERLEVGDVPQQQKRLRLVEIAFGSGVVSLSDLDR